MVTQRILLYTAFATRTGKTLKIIFFITVCQNTQPYSDLNDLAMFYKNKNLKKFYFELKTYDEHRTFQFHARVISLIN